MRSIVFNKALKVIPGATKMYRWFKRIFDPNYGKPISHMSLDYRIKRDMALYEKKMGYSFDIYNPRTFTEKIQWYKVFYGEDLWRLIDKVTFKDFIREKLGDGWTIPMYGAWTSIESLKKDWDFLPEEFCLKSNSCDNGRNIKIIHHKSQVDFEELGKEIVKWLDPMKTLQNSNCIAYKYVIPTILAEEYMANFKDQLYDYKFFCFDGNPFCMYVATEHFNEEDYPITFYDFEWNKLDVQYGIHQTSDVPCPPHFEEMKMVAAKLSKGYPFIRVDFFDTEDKLFLAELTLYPGGGLTPYCPESFNIELGNMFKVPCGI